MSDIDLSAAVEAAGRAKFEREYPHMSWDDIPPINRHAWSEVARPLIAAAAPLIEAQVREQVAAEIEAFASMIGFETPALAIECAARIARGQS